MSRVTREAFVNRFEGASLDAGALDGDIQRASLDAGLAPSDLSALAGADGVISGRDELGELFDLLDTVDHDGSYRSIATSTWTDGHEVMTASGELYAVLSRELERTRIAGAAATPVPGASASASGRAHAPASEDDWQRTVATLGAAGFTDIHLAHGTPYYSQAEPAWAKVSYPKSPPEVDANGRELVRTLQMAGCAPTALAMADVALRGGRTTPVSVAAFAVEHGVSGTAGAAGTDLRGLVRTWTAEHALQYEAIGGNDTAVQADRLRDGLMNGGVALVSVGPDAATGRGHFTNRGHVVLVNGCAKDAQGKEWFFVADPGHRNHARSRNGLLGADANLVQDRSLHHGAGQLRISREQLEREMKAAFIITNGARP